MIEIRGPDNLNKLKLDEFGKYDRDTSNSFFIECTNLKEALDAYCSKYNSSYRVYDGKIEHIPLTKSESKYFYYKSVNPRFGESLVDIHIQRGDQDICVKQDLEFDLLDGDIVTLGMLTC